MKMGLEDMERDAEENIEVVWDLMTALATLTFIITAVHMLLVVRPIDIALKSSREVSSGTWRSNLMKHMKN